MPPWLLSCTPGYVRACPLLTVPIWYACLHRRLRVCHHACLTAYQRLGMCVACMHPFLHVCMPTCVLACQRGCLRACLTASVPLRVPDLPAERHAVVQACEARERQCKHVSLQCFRVCMRRFVPAYKLVVLHALVRWCGTSCMHAYLPACLLAYLCLPAC